MVHYGTGRLSLKGSCSIRAPEVGGAGGAWRDGVSLCCETLPQAAGSLSAPETLHHPACSGTRAACSAVTPRSHSSSTPFHPLRKDKDFIIVTRGIKHSEIRESGAVEKNIKNHELPGRVHKKHNEIVCLLLFFLFFFCVCLLNLVAVMCVCCLLVRRRAPVPVHPVRRLFHPEGQPTASHQAPFGGETLQVSPVQLRLSQEGRPHRPFTHPLG